MADRVTQAARTLNYTGTVVLQSGRPHRHLPPRRTCTRTARSAEKLLSLDGPAREIVRTSSEVRYYFPDAKVVRFEPRTFRNAFPSLSPEQHRQPRAVLRLQVAPRASASPAARPRWWSFEPQDGLRYGAQVLGRCHHRAPAEGAPRQRARRRRRAVLVHRRHRQRASIDRDMVKPSWTVRARRLEGAPGGPGEVVAQGHRLVVGKLPPGFVKISEGFRKLAGKRESRRASRATPTASSRSACSSSRSP